LIRFLERLVRLQPEEMLMTDDTKQLATIARLLGEILGEVRKIREQQERKQSEKGSLSSPISQMK
jgi:hypothetical protein